MDISKSEVPVDAVPGIGVGNSTVERSQNKRLRIMALSHGVVLLKRQGGQGRTHALLSWDEHEEAESRDTLEEGLRDEEV
ncbi:MAG: hypothetical protein JRJ78_16725 [Deltaproteobacteria bacterium]|nr:hypothetical protein [Deltaproteobacteria bacterium]